MPSFRTSLTPHKRAAARFVFGVRRALLKALAEENKRVGLTQTAIAQTLGVHRSVVNRELRGTANMSIGRVAEIASAMGLEPRLELYRPQVKQHQNITPADIPSTSAPAPAARRNWDDINAQLNNTQPLAA